MNSITMISANIVFLFVILFLIFLLLSIKQRRKFRITTINTQVNYLDKETVQKIREVQHSKEKSYVIIAECDSGLRNRYKQLIESTGTECIGVEDGVDVYDVLISYKCKLLVINPMITGPVDGFQVTKTVRELIGLNFPIIVLTGLISETIQREAYEIGVNEYLIRDQTEDIELKKAIRRLTNPINTVGIIIKDFISIR